ncbi:MAG: hypothetical protein Q7J25_06570 [Vicinamibacterales bacterium]|nr:hypothetical protein [Vicinamibacterales bacterium]
MAEPTRPSPGSGEGPHGARAIRASFTILANTALLLIVVCLGLHVVLLAWYARERDNKAYYADLSPEVRANYAHMSPDDVDALLRATWNPGWLHEPWTGFRERARTSRFVNVDASGLRMNRAGESPLARLDGAIWVFGGSTTFGYGVADTETIPAQLEQLLGRPVVNFGRADYYSAQENVLLQQFLGAGFRPSDVWFLDGINERCDLELYQRELGILFDRTQATYRWDLAELVKPVSYAAGRLWSATSTGQKATREREARRWGQPCMKYGRTTPLAAVVSANLTVRSALCTASGVSCTTFVQPFAGTHGTLAGHNIDPQERAGLGTLFAQTEAAFRQSGARFVTHALDGSSRHAFVDPGHYSAWANRAIARTMADSLGMGRPSSAPR